MTYAAYYLDDAGLKVTRVEISSHNSLDEAIAATKNHAEKHVRYNGIVDEEVENGAYDMAANLSGSIRIYGAEPN
jgi:hypothetical protein